MWHILNKATQTHLCTPVAPALGRWRKQNQKFKVMLGYLTRLKPACTLFLKHIKISVKWKDLHIKIKARHLLVSFLKHTRVWRTLSHLSKVSLFSCQMSGPTGQGNRGSPWGCFSEGWWSQQSCIARNNVRNLIPVRQFIGAVSL